MNVLVENNADPLKQQRSATKTCRKMSNEIRESSNKKGTSIVRRTKKSINNNFRYSLHEISNDTKIKEEGTQQQQPPLERRLRRSRSFHVTDEHFHVQQRDRTEILKQYVANCFQINVDDLDANENITNIKYDPTDGTFPIHDAIEKHSIKDIAIYLLRHENINIEQTNNLGQTPLILAVSIGLVDVVKLLVASGASVNTKDNYGVSALRYAVDDGDFEMASLLISNGANAAAVQNGF